MEPYPSATAARAAKKTRSRRIAAKKSRSSKPKPRGTSSKLLPLPNEILLNIFPRLWKLQDACNLAQTCSQLYRLFNGTKNKIEILRAVAKVPKKPGCDLGKAFSAFIRLSHEQWAYRYNAHNWFVIHVEYSLFPQAAIASHAVRDLIGIRTHAWAQKLPFHHSLMEFLGQFDNPKPFVHDFADWGIDLLRYAAKLQRHLLSKESAEPVDMSDEITVIALALHCLVVVRNLNQAFDTDAFDPGDWLDAMEDNLPPESDDGWVTLRDPVQDEMIPFVAARHCSRRSDAIPDGVTACKSTLEVDAEIGSTLSRIVRQLFGLLEKQDPRNWPTVLYTLLILSAVGWTLSEDGWPPMYVFAPCYLSDTIRHLSQYYFISTNGGHPFKAWDAAAHRVMTGTPNTGRPHWEMLNKLWRHRCSPHTKANKSCSARMENFYNQVVNFWNC